MVMRRIMRAVFGFFTLVLFSSLIGVASCSTSMTTGEPDRVPVYLPYVESVEVDSPVRVGEDVQVTVHWSSQANPGLLQGYSNTSAPYGSRLKEWVKLPYGPASTIEIRPWIYPEAVSAGSPVEFVEYNLGFFQEPGEYSITVQSAPSRAQGGALEYAYGGIDADVTDFPQHSQAVFTQPITITVLPAEDAPGEGG
jgi:hypothetical protein